MIIRIIVDVVNNKENKDIIISIIIKNIGVFFHSISLEVRCFLEKKN